MNHDTRHDRRQFRAPPIAMEAMRTITLALGRAGLQVTKVAHRGLAVRMVF